MCHACAGASSEKERLRWLFEGLEALLYRLLGCSEACVRHAPLGSEAVSMPGSYLLSSVLAGCLKASKESRGLKVGPSMLCFSWWRRGALQRSGRHEQPASRHFRARHLKALARSFLRSRGKLFCEVGFESGGERPGKSTLVDVYKHVLDDSQANLIRSGCLEALVCPVAELQALKGCSRAQTRTAAAPRDPLERLADAPRLGALPNAPGIWVTRSKTLSEKRSLQGAV